VASLLLSRMTVPVVYFAMTNRGGDAEAPQIEEGVPA